ncbi:uncharacterized protein LOC141903426 [Tubulanus polymorphus]|uniref:uncharacterized protein LOC141903426 n=1 Tax=Tubulanus polymorphus TaxID=672921 RepID=UPI003DA2AEA4
MGRVRKKNIVYVCLSGLVLYVILQAFYLYDNDSYSPLRPLYNAKNEASRLLKFLSSYHYQCNITAQIGNRSYWPLCLETDMAIDLESKDKKIAYSIGPSYDYVLEKNLAANFSFDVFLVGPDEVPNNVRRIPNITVIKTNVVPNDYADFSRNSFGQSTLNFIMDQRKHKQIEILKLQELNGDAPLWELLHFLINDDLLPRTKQLFLQVAIDKLDDDYLYNWYRVLYELFYKAGFKLYHTSASDSLCLQVTLMQSCVYYMSWIHDPGPSYFAMHPPADYGTLRLEENRLLTYLGTGHTWCPAVKTIGDGKDSFDICEATVQSKIEPCIVYTYSTRELRRINEQLTSIGCTVNSYIHISDSDRSKSIDDLRHQTLFRKLVNKYQKPQVKSGVRSISQSVDELGKESRVSLMLIDLEDLDWTILNNLMSNNILKNVSQIVMNFNAISKIHGKHPMILRHKYSSLQQLSRHGFTVFRLHETDFTDNNKHQTNTDISNCCFQIGFLHGPVSVSLRYQPWGQ